MAESKDGIEVGEFEGPEVDAKASEPKQRGGEGSAKAISLPTTGRVDNR